MGQEYFIIYLIYGFVYILFGLRILSVNKRHVQSSYLVKSFKFIALFGITHGLSEWLTMLRISELFYDYDILIQNTKYILKMLSFVFLMQFGFNVIVNKRLKIAVIKYLPTLFASIYLIIFTTLIITRGQDYFILNQSFNIIYIRYFLGMCGGLLAALAVYTEIKTLKSPNQMIKQSYQFLMVVFIIYAIVDGLIVRPTPFFPGNIINNTRFLIVFGFRVQYLKILVGVVLYFTVARVIQSLEKNLSTSIHAMQMSTIETDARCKIGIEMHDLIIQDLYGIKLKVLALTKRYEEKEELKVLHLNIEEALKKTRIFMQDASFKRMSFQEVINNINRLQTVFEESNTVTIKTAIDEAMTFSKSNNNFIWSQLYLSIQEALLNAFKHSKATGINLSIYEDNASIVVKVEDNGIGINLEKIDPNNAYGIVGMNHRIKSINGNVDISTQTKGTLITIRVPIEGVMI